MITSYYTFSPLSKTHGTRTATIVCLIEMSNIERVRENNRWRTGNNSCSGRSRGGGLIFKPKKIWGGTAPPLCKGWMTPPPPLSQGLGPALSWCQLQGEDCLIKMSIKRENTKVWWQPSWQLHRGKGRGKKTQQGKGRVRRNEQKQSSYRRCLFHHLPCGLHLIDDVSHSCFHQKFFFSTLRMIKVFMQWYIQLYLLR